MNVASPSTIRAAAPESEPRRGRRMAAVFLLLGLVVAALTLLRDNGGAREAVRTATAARGPLTSRVLAQGRVRAREQVEVASEIGGRVQHVAVKSGDTVKAGDLLFALDDEQLKNTVEQLRVATRGADALLKRATLGVAEAERALARDTALKDKAVLAEDAWRLTQSRFDLAQAELEQAKAQQSRAELDLSRAKDAVKRAAVFAPIAGTVVSVGVEVGQVVSAVSGISASGDLPGLSMASSASAPVVIADLSSLIVKLDVDELDVSQVKLGQSARITAQGIKPFAFEGAVERVGLMGREQQGAVLFAIEVGVQKVVPADDTRAPVDVKGNEATVVALPMPRDVLRPGMSAQAEIEVEKLDDAITIPVSAVLEGKKNDTAPLEAQNDHVFVVRDLVVKRRVVQLGPSEGDKIAILDGLTAGEVVVEGPFRTLKTLDDGDAVVLESAAKRATP